MTGVLLELSAKHNVNKNVPLTEREGEVALLAAGGSSVEEVAARLSISEHTVKTHLEHVYRKLGVRNRAQLVRSLLERGEISRTADRKGADEGG